MEPTRTKWDTAGFALLGAGLGMIMQGSHELLQNVIAKSAKQEAISHILLEIAVGTLAGAILFAAIAAIRNRAVVPAGGRRRAFEVTWHRSDFIFPGAALAILLMLVHEGFDFFTGRWEFECGIATDPFSHLVQEFVIAGIAGEVMFRAIAKIRKWSPIRDNGAQTVSGLDRAVTSGLYARGVGDFEAWACPGGGPFRWRRIGPVASVRGKVLSNLHSHRGAPYCRG